MSLQLSLIIIGLIIIAAVALSTYDKARLRRRYGEEKKERKPMKVAVRRALAKMESRLRASTKLDINPGPIWEAGKKLLRADAEITDSANTRKVDPFFQELEDLEQAAAIPINRGLDVAGDENIETDMPPAAELDASQQSMPDEVIDFIIALPGPGPMMRDKALGIYKQNEYKLEKPHKLYGLRYIEGVWTELDSDPETAKYGDLAVTLQLVDAKGPIDETELTTFSQMGLKLADVLARPSRHAMSFEAALQRAQELDSFCQQYDVIASINILPINPEGIIGRKIKKEAINAGMEFGAMNIFHMKNNNSVGCRHMFSLADLYEPGEFRPEEIDATQIKGLTLFMHIPSTVKPDKAYDKMVNTATHLANTLGGKLYDQEKHELSNDGLAVIRKQIVRIEQGMEEFGVTPGSERALRLFSL